jgi:peptide/nickel transport system substrate-binding protein
VGTGPWKLDEYTEGVEFVTVKNPDYFKPGLPYMDGVTYYIIGEDQTQVDALVTGRVDVGQPQSGFSQAEQYDRIINELPEANLVFHQTPNNRFFWVNMNFEPFQDVRVRRALALMIDSEELVLAGYGMLELGYTGNAIFSDPWMLPHEESHPMLGWDMTWEERVAEAQALMAEAGYADGFKCNILVRIMAIYERQCAVFADKLRTHLNIEAEVVARERAESIKMRNAGDFDLYFDQIMCWINDLDEYATYFGTGLPGNWGSYSNPEIDRLFDEQSRATDLNNRINIAQDIERILIADLPVLPLGSSKCGFDATQSYVKGYTPAVQPYTQAHTRFEYVWFDK